MKILLVNSRYAPFSVGGADVSTRKLAIELKKRGNIVDVLTCNNDDVDDYYDDIPIHRRKFKNIDSWYNYHNLRGIRKFIFKFLDVYNFSNKSGIKEILLDIKPDVVHTNNINGITPVIWTVCNELRIPVVHTCRDYFLMCEKTTLVRKNNIVCVNPRLICKIYRAINKLLCKKVDLVTAPSKYTLNCFLDAGFFKKSKSRCVYNAIDVDLTRTLELLNERKNRQINIFRFIYLGALEKHKGVDLILDAIRSNGNKSFSIAFAGRGSLEKNIKSLAQIDNRVEYLGFIEKDILDSEMKKSNALLCPSNWPEPFGRVVIDAYKYAMPVIATNLGGLDEIVNEKTGIKIEAGSSTAINDAIDKMINDQERYIDMCANAAFYLEEFLIGKQAETFEFLYKSI